MEIQIKKGLDSLQTETVLRLLSQTVWACSRRKEAIIESWKHSVCYGALYPLTEDKSDLREL